MSQLKWFGHLTRILLGETPVQTQDMLETLDLLAGLRTPWCSPDKLEEVTGEREGGLGLSA